MQLMQQIDTMRVREITADKYEDMMVYVCITLFLTMTTALLIILSL